MTKPRYPKYSDSEYDEYDEYEGTGTGEDGYGEYDDGNGYGTDGRYAGDDSYEYADGGDGNYGYADGGYYEYENGSYDGGDYGEAGSYNDGGYGEEAGYADGNYGESDSYDDYDDYYEPESRRQSQARSRRQTGSGSQSQPRSRRQTGTDSGRQSQPRSRRQSQSRRQSGQTSGRQPQTRRRRGLSLMVIVVIVCLLIIIAAICALIWAGGQDDSTEAATTAATTEAIVTEAETTTAALTTEAPTTAVPDIIPPVIEGVQDITAIRGSSISYLDGITVTDNADENPVITVDNSQVDTETVGTYTVIYVAMDASGNMATASATITIEPKEVGEENLEKLQAMAQEIIDENINSSLSDLKKIYKAFWWVKNNLEYVNDSDKTSWINEGIRGIEEGQGDCFTFYSVLKILLNTMGFETVDVQRLGGETQHFWLLVKYKDEYYHIDACPRNPRRDPEWYCFLRTDAELQAWSPNYENFYNFDTSLYPATATEPLNLGYMQHE